MARVVQRRSSPPYLLIIFVFLFLVATALAVMFYMNYDKAARRASEREAEVHRLAVEADRSSPAVKEMLAQADKPGAKSVVYQLVSRVEELATAITPENRSFDYAKKAADDVYAQIGSTVRRGLVAELLEKNRQLTEEQKRARSLEADRVRLETQNSETVKQKDDLTRAHQADLDKLSGQIKDLDGKVKTNYDQYQANLARINQEIDKKTADYEKRVTELFAEINKYKDESRVKGEEILKQRDVIARLRGQKQDVVPTADGKILKVTEGEKICYVSLGTKDRAMVGLTLAVYPATGIVTSTDEQGKVKVAPPKARVQITDVSENISTCRIVEEDNRDPVAVDDLVSNLAFDAVRTYRFVVAGLFDLRGTGHPSEEGTDEVRAMIRRSGGEIVTQLDYQTDVVVLGAAPARPAPPPEGATPQVQAVYREQLKAVEQFDDIRRKAENFRPVLNTNDFLDYMGYNPPRTTQ